MSNTSCWAKARQALSIVICLLCLTHAEYQDATASKVWVYSLVGTDYDGYKMLPHFLDHYRSMGVPNEQFHFDLLHDPSEPDHGVKASCLHLVDTPNPWNQSASLAPLCALSTSVNDEKGRTTKF